MSHPFITGDFVNLEGTNSTISDLSISLPDFVPHIPSSLFKLLPKGILTVKSSPFSNSSFVYLCGLTKTIK